MQPNKKSILAICGSTRKESVNLHILQELIQMFSDAFSWNLFDAIDQLPHFNPDLDITPAPESVQLFREAIEKADGVLICTPEYVFSLPGSLKNAIEWTVSTVLFTNKPTALITASSQGLQASQALAYLMKTLGAKTDEGCSLLIQAPKNKVSTEGKITDPDTRNELVHLMEAFSRSITDPVILTD